MSMVNITEYDNMGRLSFRRTVQKEMVEQAVARSQSAGYVMGWRDEATEYVVDGQIKLRPENPTKLVGTTLTNVPLGALICIEKEVYPTNDTSIDLEFATPGTYKVRVEAFPYRDVTFEVTA